MNSTPMKLLESDGMLKGELDPTANSVPDTPHSLVTSPCFVHKGIIMLEHTFSLTITIFYG